MIPGIDPRQMKAMMRQMGMSQTELDASEVIIKTGDKEIVFSNPNVQKIVMQGQTTFQIAGSYEERDLKVKIEISNDDIKMVSEQAGVSHEEAQKALENSNGDIAEAIVSLSE